MIVSTNFLKTLEVININHQIRQNNYTDIYYKHEHEQPRAYGT